MTFYPMQLFAEILAGHSGPEIPAPTRAYFEQRLRNRLFKFLIEKFADAQKDGLSQATLARRIGRKPDVVNRWLSSPSNLTADTICVLLLGIAGEEFEPNSSSPFADPRLDPFANLSWLRENTSLDQPVERDI